MFGNGLGFPESEPVVVGKGPDWLIRRLDLEEKWG